MKKSIFVILILVFCFSIAGCMQNNSTSTSATPEITFSPAPTPASSPTATSTPIPTMTPTQTTTTTRKSLGITLKQFTDGYNREGTVFLVYDNYKFGKTIDQNITQYTNVMVNKCVYIYANCYGNDILDMVGIGIDKNALKTLLSTKGEDYITSAVSSFLHYFVYGIFPSYSTAKCDAILSDLLNSTPVLIDGAYVYVKQVDNKIIRLNYDPTKNIYVLTATYTN